jgi:hypothetical protein
MTALKKGDIVKIGRKKDRYRVKQISASGGGAVLIETLDAKPYATTYVNAELLTLAKGESSPPPPAEPSEFLVKLTDQDGSEALVTVKALDDEAAAAAGAAKAEADDPDGAPFAVTSVEPFTITTP